MKKTIGQLATAQFERAGFGPKGTREWDFMQWAFLKGFVAGQRRGVARYLDSRCGVCHTRKKRGGNRQGSELCEDCYHQG
jgi:hypothetical protein